MLPGLPVHDQPDGLVGDTEFTAERGLALPRTVPPADLNDLVPGQAGIAVFFTFADSVTEGPVPDLILLVLCAAAVGQVPHSVDEAARGTVADVHAWRAGTEESRGD
jgi:hypothetical protein